MELNNRHVELNRHVGVKWWVGVEVALRRIGRCRGHVSYMACMRWRESRDSAEIAPRYNRDIAHGYPAVTRRRQPAGRARYFPTPLIAD